jgi:DNA-binding NarL/FixJ family response regulator
MPETITILIADDHPVFREGLRSLLETTSDLHVIAEASTGREAVQRTLELRPDITLMDVTMPDGDGIAAVREIRQQIPNANILMLTMLQDDDTLFKALRAGSRGYFLKGSTQAQILHAIRGVAAGDAIFGPGVAERVIHYFSITRPPNTPSFPELTTRELEILKLMTQRISNPEIAQHLDLGSKTVRNYVSSIISKLQVADRNEAIALANSTGLNNDN